MFRGRKLAFVAGVVAIACGAHSSSAPTPRRRIELTVWPPDSTVEVRATPLALAQLDTIARETRASRIEQAWCAPDYELAIAHGHTIVTVQGLERSQYVAAADSIHISASRPLCDDGIPGLHSHVIWAGGWLYFPSPTDYNTASSGTAPFHLLLSAGDTNRVTRLTVYALRSQ